MAIFLYVGINGSGKSYEAVKSVVVPAIASGRRVITNIYGLSPQKISQYCITTLKAESSKLGDLVTVDNSVIQKDDFFLSKENPDAFVKPGDLVIIDEAWRVFPDGNKLTSSQQSFFAEHRHFTDPETGLSCDIALITQSADELPKFIRSRTDTTFRMANLGSLNFSKGYKVEQYTGSKLWATRRITMSTHKYQPVIFDLYQSHDTKNGKSVTVDSRKGLPKIFFFLLIGSVIFVFLSFTFVPNLLTKRESHVVHTPPVKTAQLTSTIQPSSYSSNWRIAGTITKKGHSYVILAGQGGKIRLEYRSIFTGNGLMLNAVIDGQNVSYFSGTPTNDTQLTP